MIGLSWLAVEVTASLPSLPQTSQAQPEPNRVAPALAKASLNAAKPPSSPVMAVAIAPVGSPPPPGFMICQKSEWLAWPPPLFRTAVRIPSGNTFRSAIKCLDRLALMIGMVLERGVQIVDIRRMMLAVVDFHGLGIDVRLQGTKVVWQRRQGVLGHGVAPRRISKYFSHGRRRSPCRSSLHCEPLPRAPIPTRSSYHIRVGPFKWLRKRPGKTTLAGMAMPTREHRRRVSAGPPVNSEPSVNPFWRCGLLRVTCRQKDAGATSFCDSFESSAQASVRAGHSSW